MEKEQDKIIKDLFQEIGTESPSENFKDNLMDKIYALEKGKQKVYEPLIPRKALIWIATITGIVLLVLLFLMPGTFKLDFPFEFNFSFSFPQVNLPNISLSFPDYNIPNIWIYILLTLPMFFVFERVTQKFMEKRNRITKPEKGV